MKDTGDNQSLDIQWLFPVPLFRLQLEDYAAHREALIDFALKLRTEDAGVNRSNVGGWHSSDIRKYFGSPPLDWVEQQIVTGAANGIAQSRQLEPNFDIQIGNSWFIINQKNTWNSPHTHMPSQWSGVLYISVNKQNAGEDGGRIIFIDPIPLGPAYRNLINAQVEPAEGLMLIFPSYLTHMVAPHSADEERISLSFNFQALLQQ